MYLGERFRDSGIYDFEEAIFGYTSSGWMGTELLVAILHHLNDFVFKMWHLDNLGQKVSN